MPRGSASTAILFPVELLVGNDLEYASGLDGGYDVRRAVSVICLSLFLSALTALEVPPTERSFRFLVADDHGEPAEGVPLHWISEIYVGLNAYGGRLTKEVVRKTMISGKDGVVEIPKHTFGTCLVSIKDLELRDSAVWMLDSKTRSQFIHWDVYRKLNPENGALGAPVPGFDGVFKVLSKQGISNLARYNIYYKQVPSDGTPTPLQVLGRSSAQGKIPEQVDVVMTINRPDQAVLPRKPGEAGIAKPLRVPWVLEGKTLRFAHFAPDTDLSADYHHRTWTQRLDIQPTHPDHETSEGAQALRLWALIPGEPPLVVPLKCRIELSLDSTNLGKAVYLVNFEVILPLAPCARYHPDLLSIGHYTSIAPQIPGEAIDARLDPIRAAAIAHVFPDDLITTPVLRYDTNPTLPYDWHTLPVLLP
jgi:hypothetical protein